MDRAERIGWGAAGAGHVLVFGALSLGLTLTPKTMPPLTQPVDIQIVDEVGLRDSAPNPSPVEPAASVAPEVGPPVEAPPPPPAPAPPAPAPLPRAAPPPPPRTVAPSPRPQPKTAAPAPRAQPKAATAPPRPKLALNLDRPSASTQQQAPRGSRLGNDFLRGVTDRPPASTSQAPRAAPGPAVEASLGREVIRQIKPHWRAPSGADADQLRTTLRVELNRDGTVGAVRVLGTTGQTDSNRGQVKLHQEAAIRAVRLAAPFVLPAELYDAWKVLDEVRFDKRLG